MIERLKVELKANHAPSEDNADLTHRKKIVLAIIGARTMVNQRLFDKQMKEWVEKYGEPDEIISGGAIGADTMGEMYATKKRIPITILKPDYQKYPGRYAPMIRNTDIIEHCSHVLAFPSRTGKGTQDALRKAKKLKRNIWECWID